MLRAVAVLRVCERAACACACRVECAVKPGPARRCGVIGGEEPRLPLSVCYEWSARKVDQHQQQHRSQRSDSLLLLDFGMK